MSSAPVTPPRRRWLALLLIGVAVGLASGMFGVGGGFIAAPALLYLLGFDPRVAAGTSLFAIVLPAITGVAGYALGGNVHVLMAALLAGGSMLGAPFGSWLLAKLPRRAVQLAFLIFLFVVMVSLFLVVPSRDAEVTIDLGFGAFVVLLGIVAGVLAGLLGIGGGVIVVPAMVLLLGVSDLVAKGTSLLMIIATGLSGTIANVRHGNVDLRAALLVGVGAAAVTPLGVWIAQALDPFWANVAFSGFLVIVAVRLALDIWPPRRRRR